MRINIYLIVAFFLFFFGLNLLTLYDGHNWGGDFAQYILHAQNLLNGMPYTQGIMLEERIIYPPGFPLLLAPLIKIFGVNFIILKTLNLLFWAGATILIYRLSRKYNDKNTALLCAMMLCASSIFFTFKQNILSDIPFMFLTIAALYTLETRRWLLAFALIYCAILTRSMGIVLSLSAMIYFGWIKKDAAAVIWIAICTAAAIGTQTWITRGLHPAFFNPAGMQPLKVIRSLYENTGTMWQSLIWFYSPGQTQQTAVIYLFAAGCAAIAAPFLWLGVMIISLKKLITKDLLLIECFCFIYMVALFVWSYFGATPQVFARFIFPLAGLLPVIFSYRFSSHVQRGAIKVLLIAFVLINTFNMARLYGFNDDVLVTVNNNQEMFSWIKKNTDPQGHFMFWEPRTVALMTKRVGTTLAWLSFNPNDQWHIILRQKNIRFLILNKTGDKEFIKYFCSQPWAKTAWANPDYLIVEITS